MRDIIYSVIFTVLIVCVAHNLFKLNAAHRPAHTETAVVSAQIKAAGRVIPASLPPKISHANDPNKPIIAIIIDDVGVDKKRSQRAIRLPAAVTMAYLPYSPKIAEQTAAAKAAGHQLMVHLPMQPERAGLDPGPNYLGVDLPPEEVARRVKINLDSFSGYVAVNNHMGSQFTQDRERLMILMAAIRMRPGVMFIDSKTAPQSIAERIAREFGIESNHRDIFIDHSEDAAAVAAELEHIERLARKFGSAIAIGHPKDVTLNALEKWLPTLRDKGFKLVPVTEAIEFRQQRAAAKSAKN